MKTLKWGILSTANIAKQALIPAIKAANNAELLAIASESGKAHETAATFDIPKAYDSYHELLDDPSIDAVYIPLPNALHKKWAIEAAKKGKHVLCEKPAALTPEDARAMIDACEENHVVFMEAFMYQFHPQHQRVKEIIESGEIGEIQHIQSTFTFTLDLESENIRINPTQGGGSIYDVGSYCIHVSRFLFEEEPSEVYTSASLHPELGVETSANGMMSFSKGRTASFYCSFEQPMVHKYEISGTKGSIFLPLAFRPDLTQGNGEIVVTDEKGTTRKEVVHGDQYKLQVEHFSTAALQQSQTSYTGQQTVNNLKAIHAFYQSMESKQPVRLT